MTASYIQVPPDSTGKKILHEEHTVGPNTVQAPVYHLADPVSPDNKQKVDNRGQASVRFAEGSPSMDAFGNLRVSDARILGAYEYSNSNYSDLFTDLTSGGTITYNQDKSETILSVNSTNGSAVSRTTNRYHFYQPGVGNLIIITGACSDTGKTGNVRRWGYYDEDDGLFFELNGTTLNVVLRSSAGGTVTEERIPSSNWNGDKLDGTGLSGMSIDLTKANFYWIDFAWLGVGPVRFGVLGPDGARWVCHTFQNPNSKIGAYMNSGSKPLKFENFNSQNTSGTSEFKHICAAVYAESNVDYTFWRFSDIGNDLKSVNTNTPLVSIRPKLMNGTKVNRIGLYPECISFVVIGGIVKVDLIDNGTLTGATWSINGESLAQGDSSATAITGGSKFHTYYLDEGVHHFDVSKIYETNDEGYHTLANASTPDDVYSMSIVATKVTGTTVQCAATINYRELQ